MSFIKDVIELIKVLFGLLTESTISVWLSVVGLLLLLATLGLIWKAMTTKPDEFKMKIGLFTCLGFAIFFSLAGPAFSLLDVASERSKGFEKAIISPKEGLEQLRKNAEVRWLIRLVPYDPLKNSELSVDQLTYLGRDNQQYTFVADYSELRGYTVYDAVSKIGGSLTEAERVSAIIFPLDKRELRPANARGLLQVIDAIDRASSSDPRQNYVAFNVQQYLNPDEREDLKDFDIGSWSFDKCRPFFNRYCKLAQAFRCNNKFSAKALIGDVSRDWHPLGLSQRVIPSSDPCKSNPVSQCEFTDWNAAEQLLESKFGARVFLIENLQIPKIRGRILIDFYDPKHQRIPDIGID